MEPPSPTHFTQGFEAWQRGDYAEAVKRYREGAEQAMLCPSLCHAYFFGEAVPQDYAEAAKWLRKAAEQGDAEAQEFLGEMYAREIGVTRDYAQLPLLLVVSDLIAITAGNEQLWCFLQRID
jgi:TPR repeat protein